MVEAQPPIASARACRGILLWPMILAAACGGRSELFASEDSIPAEAGPSDGGTGAVDVALPDVFSQPPPDTGADAEPREAASDADADAVEETFDACASGCPSPAVSGGTYDRSFDGIGYTDDTNPATVSSFQLDRYEVTVGRFRPFVAAVVGGWLPAAGSGKHTHLNGGQGLAATAGGFETGWDATDWNGQIATTASAWNSNLASGTWTPAAGSNEELPITQVDWYEAYAFCIWDGGFLPSEAEWNYAAAAGSEQRAYPWSAAFPPGSDAIDCTQANYDPCPPGGVAFAVGSTSPAGDGKWGHSDLAGNVWEWTLDWYEDNYVTPCVDCAELTEPEAGPLPMSRVIRGGSFGNTSDAALVSYRGVDVPYSRADDLGIRCARAP
jgi:formylglycine-generating enzyme